MDYDYCRVRFVNNVTPNYKTKLKLKSSVIYYV